MYVIDFVVLEAIQLDLKEGHLPYLVSFLCGKFKCLIVRNATTRKEILSVLSNQCNIEHICQSGTSLVRTNLNIE